MLGDTQHVCIKIISNHANLPPCFLEVPFVDMVFMNEIEINKSFGFVSHLQPGEGGGGGGNLCKKCDVQGGGGSGQCDGSVTGGRRGRNFRSFCVTSFMDDP